MTDGTERVPDARAAGDAAPPAEARGPHDADSPPTARVRRRRFAMSVVWVVPVLAAVVAGYLVFTRLAESGTKITITFRDGNGVKAGQTEIRYRGVPIGEVKAIDLSRDEQSVVVTARLRRSASAVARDGSVFWVVRPEVGFGSISGLSTVITGPFIQVLPGSGKSRTAFTGLESPPLATERQGLKLVLAAADLGSMRTGAPVYYRGVQVGVITAIDLSADATSARAHVFVSPRYVKLVRVGSRFWTVSGLDINLSLLRGLEVNMESLRSLATGGIAFATPDDPAGVQARDGTIFVLHDKPDKAWLQWTPKITLPPER
jgi:paraquat-inducible protein B